MARMAGKWREEVGERVARCKGIGERGMIGAVRVLAWQLGGMFVVRFGIL